MSKRDVACLGGPAHIQAAGGRTDGQLNVTGAGDKMQRRSRRTKAGLSVSQCAMQVHAVLISVFMPQLGLDVLSAAVCRGLSLA